MKKTLLLISALSAVAFANISVADEGEVTGMMGTYKIETNGPVASGMMTNGGLATAVNKDAKAKEAKSASADTKKVSK